MNLMTILKRLLPAKKQKPVRLQEPEYTFIRPGLWSCGDGVDVGLGDTPEAAHRGYLVASIKTSLNI